MFDGRAVSISACWGLSEKSFPLRYRLLHSMNPLFPREGVLVKPLIYPFVVGFTGEVEGRSVSSSLNLLCSRAHGARIVRRMLFAVLCVLGMSAIPAQAISLKTAIKVALEANPEIGEAIANREALEFELKQARGLYLPKFDIEGRYGAQNYVHGMRLSSVRDRHVAGIECRRVQS